MALLGFSTDPQQQQMYSLLGIDPAQMRRQALFNGLAAAGFALMSNKNPGRAGEAFLLGTNQGQRDAMQNAMDMYRVKSAADEQTYQRQRDAASDKRYADEFAFRKQQAADEAARQRRIDAQNNTLFGYKVDEQNRLEDQRKGQQDYVTNWMTGMNQQGAGLPMSPEVRAIGRAGGVAGPSATDAWRYGNAQPYVGAQDYGNAFSQITAQPPKPEQFNLGPGEVRKDENGKTIAEGPPKADNQPSDLQILSQINTERQAKGQPPMSTEEFLAVKRGGGIKISPDGTITIGGPAGAGTEADQRAKLLQQQAESSFDTATKYFDELSTTVNSTASNIPGGRAIMSGKAQAGDDALANIVANWLYLSSGATANPGEVVKQVEMLKPSPLDKPEAIAGKKARLQLMIDTMRARAGVPVGQSGGQSGDKTPTHDLTVDTIPENTPVEGEDGNIYMKRNGKMWKGNANGGWDEVQ